MSLTQAPPPPPPQAKPTSRFIEFKSNKEDEIKRRKTCRFIEEAGRVLKLPRVAISTAEVFFHRFYAKHSFQDHDRFEVAVAAIVLAAKTEEAPKKLNNVIQECFKLKARGMQAGRISQQKLDDGSTPPPPPSIQATTAGLDPKGDEFLKLKDRILLLERIILHTIGFELSIDHPYKFFVEQIKKLIFTRKLRYTKTPAALANSSTKDVMSKMMNELVQYSMSLANDSYQTSLCLQFSPEEIATACVYLACQFAGVEPANAADWKTTLGDPDVDALFSICVQILDLISDKKASDMENVKKIRAALELMRTRDEQAAAAAQQAASQQESTKANLSPKPDPGATPPPPPPPAPTDDSNPNKRPRFG
ncbi:cyclin-like protein [Nitzschia inconspicua]|uniref:Cyclin-like protein n=1 Tax=Nitzschia inconspicua TaxID=303405 RepID=A0A9K3PP72_9STRA|nr:cyclin-like protein [Nitzschia inconspicua]